VKSSPNIPGRWVSGKENQTPMARGPGQGNSNFFGARPVHQIITMINWIRTSRLPIKNSLAGYRWMQSGRIERPRAMQYSWFRNYALLLVWQAGVGVLRTTPPFLQPSSSSLLLSSLELSDTKVYEPQIRALLGTAPASSFS